ncbi:efflux RND transporter periplasmic adaptor subunit [Marinomonas epiphytica]
MELKSKVGPITAVVVAASAVFWMVSGESGVTSAPQEAEQVKVSPKAQSSEQAQAYPVQARTITAQTIDTKLALSGKTLANEILELRNRLDGRITALSVQKGDFLKEGQTLLYIDTRVLESQIKQARLLVKQRQLEFDGIKKLSANNYSSQANLATAEANLATAQSQLQSLLVDLENAELHVPFSGIINRLDVQNGAYIGNTDVVAQLVSLDPLRVQVNIPQNKTHKIGLGTQANIRFENGISTTGKVSFVSATANEASRTISVEALVNNPDNLIPAGLSAKVNFVLDNVKAHAFSPALLTLDEQGNTAIKTLSLDNHVEITPVEIIRSERDKVWVIGLNDSVNIITVGQGFVSAGDLVEAHYQE